jgi:serine/threonine-protein kinase
VASTTGKILSAFGKLGILAVIAAVFAISLIGTVYLSLRSPEIQVPDVVNKSYLDGETTLDRAGLDIRERAKRFKPDVKAGIILDQSPRPGEVVKAGQTIAVVVSREPKEGEKVPSEEDAKEKKPEGANAQENSRAAENAGNLPANNDNQNRDRRPKNTNKNSNANKNANNRNSNNNNGNRSANNGNTGVNRNTTNNNANANRNRNTNTRPGTNSNAARNTNTARPVGANTNRRPGL